MRLDACSSSNDINRRISERSYKRTNMRNHARYNYRNFENNYTAIESLIFINKYYPHDKDLNCESKSIGSLKRHTEESRGLLQEFTERIKEEGKRLKTMNKNIINNPILIRAENAMIEYCINKLKSEFSTSIRIDFDHVSYKKFLSWLKKYDKHFNKHISKVPFKPHFVLRNADFIIRINEFTFARILSGESMKNKLSERERDYKSITSVMVETYGRDAKKVAYLIEKIHSGDNHLIQYTISTDKENDVEIYRDIRSSRNSESVFLNENVKETILNHVNKFFNNKPIYDKRNLTYKTGILLYGEAGTGKTTIANMIATESNCNLVVIKMDNFANMDTDYITSTINADDETYVVLLEDIDCVIGNRESENDDLENKKNVNKLLQFLDSTSSPSNVIFVATTNHIEKLDDAILRAGRFDLKVNITNINEKSAAQMCKSFGIKDEATIKRLFKENNVDGKINPAKLQNLILQELN